MTLLCFITIMCFVVCAMFGRYLAWQNTQQNTQVGRLAIKTTLLGNCRYFLASFHLVQNLPSKCELGASGVRQSKQHYREISVSRVSSALWAENWKIAARLRANAGGGVTRLASQGSLVDGCNFSFISVSVFKMWAPGNGWKKDGQNELLTGTFFSHQCQARPEWKRS